MLNLIAKKPFDIFIKPCSSPPQLNPIEVKPHVGENESHPDPDRSLETPLQSPNLDALYLLASLTNDPRIMAICAGKSQVIIR